MDAAMRRFQGVAGARRFRGLSCMMSE